jgi:hypothetical protein
MAIRFHQLASEMMLVGAEFKNHNLGRSCQKPQEGAFWGRYRFLEPEYSIGAETNKVKPLLRRDPGPLYYFSSGGLIARKLR